MLILIKGILDCVSKFSNISITIEYNILLLQVTESPATTPTKTDDGQVYQIEDMVDVLIKTVRLIANLSISETIGPIIAADQSCVNQLMHILSE